MSKRIINFEDGGQNGATPPPQQTRPMQMVDLLQSAEDDWKSGNKNKAFITLIGAMAMMSQGVAVAMKGSAAALSAVQRACGHRYETVDGPCVYCEYVRPVEEKK